MEDNRYVHESGLCFDVARLVSADEKSSHDITVIVLWLGGPKGFMELIDWYCGEADIELTKEYADTWCSKKSIADLADYVAAQNFC